MQPIPQGRIHDGFCRCRTCKPPLVGADRLSLQGRVVLGLAGLIVVLALILVTAS